MAEILQKLEKVGGGSSETYSESEIKIGTFLGKDLYRKVYKLNVSTSGSTDYTLSVPELNGYRFINIRAIFYDNEPGWFTSDTMGSAYYRPNTIHYRQTYAGVGVTCKAIIVEYTKEAW